MQADNTVNKPSIIICIYPHAGSQAKLRELQAGIEEEGVPCSCQIARQADPVGLGYEAAAISPLGVGIGISAAGMCLHVQKLPKLEPLFHIDSQGTPADWRLFGYNAARLVKGLPFKDKQREAVAGSSSDTAELYETVRQIVLKVLHEFAQGHGG